MRSPNRYGWISVINVLVFLLTFGISLGTYCSRYDRIISVDGSVIDLKFIPINHTDTGYIYQTYSVSIKYEYTYDKVIFQNSDIIDFKLDRTQATNYFNLIKDKITIWLDPLNPQDASVMKSQVNNLLGIVCLILGYGLGALFLVIILSACIWGCRIFLRPIN